MTAANPRPAFSVKSGALICLFSLATSLLYGQQESNVSQLPGVLEKGKALPDEASSPEEPDEAEIAPLDSEAQDIQMVARSRPAVVLVQLPTGHGTGFFVRPDGYVVTNYHVIAAAPMDPVRGVQVARIYAAHTDDSGKLQRYAKPLWASVYKVDARADLALLRVEEMPPGKARVPALQVAPSAPAAGSTCTAIGMPTAGIHWAVRRGVIVGHGRYPEDIISDAAFPGGVDRTEEEVERFIRLRSRHGSALATLSTCGINPGDSGGPLLNRSGEVVAVNVAVPADSFLKTMVYHIHRDELENFLKDLPDEPIATPPDAKPDADKVTIRQRDPQSGRVDSVGFGLRKDPDVGTFFNEDDETATGVAPNDIFLMNSEEFWKRFDIEWGYQWNRSPIYYFDLDDDGAVDQVIVPVGTSDDFACRYQRVKDGWKIDQVGGDFLDHIRFKDDSIQSQFEQRRNRLPSVLRR